jgi:hypothetical protein
VVVRCGAVDTWGQRSKRSDQLSGQAPAACLSLEADISTLTVLPVCDRRPFEFQRQTD